MLTPTGITASDYWNAIKDGHFTHIRMTFTGQSIVLDDSDIHNNGFTLTDILNSETDLVFGYAVSKQFTVSILNSSKLNNLDWTGEFTLEMGVEVGNPVTINYVQIGIFSGEKPNNVTVADVIQFTAYDRMKKFDILVDDYFNSITYPITIQDIYDDLCTFVGVTNVSGDELATIMTRSYASVPFDMAGYTCRDLLAMIAEACGCYAKITAAGYCQMVWFSDQTSYAVTGAEEFNVETVDASNAISVIDQIMIKQLDSDMDILYPSGITGTNVYLIVDNPFLAVSEASEITSYIKPIFDRLDAFGGYKPVRLDCIGNWLVEAGDIITVEVNGDDITVPVFVRTMTWNGAVNDTYEATGQANRTVISNKDQEKILNAKEIRLIIRNKYDKVNGLTITENGVLISGSQFIRLLAGYIEAGNYWFDSSGFHFLYTDPNNISYIANLLYGVHPVVGTGNWFMLYNGQSLSDILICSGNGTNEKDIELCGRKTWIRAIDKNGAYGGTVCFEKAGDQTYMTFYSQNYSYYKLWLGRAEIQNRRVNGWFDWLHVLHFDNESSREYKHDIKPIEDVGEKLDRLEPVSFKYNQDEMGLLHSGLIYEDTIRVLPEICHWHDNVKSINYIDLIPYLLKEIQSLRKRVAELEDKIK